MKRLLKFVALAAVVVLILAVVAAVFGPSKRADEQLPVAQQVAEAPTESPTEEPDPLDAAVAATTAIDIPDPTETPRPKPTKAPRPTKEPQPTREAKAAPEPGSRCESVPADIVAGIESGLTVAGGASLRGAKAVRSQDYQKVWFVAADIQGDGMEGNSQIAVWATNSIASAGAGMIFAADGLAKEFSEWGAAGIGDQFSVTDEGVAEAKECVRNAL